MRVDIWSIQHAPVRPAFVTILDHNLGMFPFPLSVADFNRDSVRRTFRSPGGGGRTVILLFFSLYSLPGVTIWRMKRSLR